MQGKIIKGIAGFYYVHVEDGSIYECKAKGIFRKDNTKPLVGDDVDMEVLDEEKKVGNISAIFPRMNTLVRPSVANVDQALVIFAITQPAPNFNLLDRFLITMERQQLPCIICFNKRDIATEEEQNRLQEIYEHCGYQVLFFSALNATKDSNSIIADREDCFCGSKEMLRLKELLCGRTTVMAGPSGVGKSSIINCLQPKVYMETGELSRKIERGRHTTRHTQLIALEGATYIMDTPGFSSLTLENIEKEELQGCYPEFIEYEAECQFGGCSHVHEPICGVQNAVREGKISKTRYENYILLYEEIKNRKKY